MRTYWVKTRTESPSEAMVSTSSVTASSFPDRPVIGPSWARYWAGWLQICFRAVSSLSTRPRRLMPSASATSSRSSVTTAL